MGLLTGPEGAGSGAKRWGRGAPDGVDGEEAVRNGAFNVGVAEGARRSNQSILKEISPGCSLEGLMLKLKLQYFGHLHAKS